MTAPGAAGEGEDDMSGEVYKTKAPGLPTDYDPEKGLKGVAVAEAAEKYYARAKDRTKLEEAIEAKLGEQRRFVLWWDQQNLNSLGNTTVADRRQYPDRSTIHRWRKRLKDSKKFDTTLQAALERCVKVCEARQGHSDLAKATNTGENEWYTPQEYVEIAREVLGGIDLDPASSDAAQKKVQAGAYFTKEQDGLQRDWAGAVWLNPPYAQPFIAEFVSKMVSEWRAGHLEAAIMLTHNYTDTAWFHEAAEACTLICFTRGRIKFYDSRGTIASPTQGQAFFYFGGASEKFAERFSEIGFVVAPT